MMQDDIRIRKLRWLCRRGMKELDVLLESFLATHTQQLLSGEWPVFESFLSREDDQIWHWLQGLESPKEPQLLSLISEIRRGS